MYQKESTTYDTPQKQNPQKDIKLYRNLLGDFYNHLTDEEVMALVQKIKAFLHVFINSRVQELFGKGKYLSPNQKK